MTTVNYADAPCRKDPESWFPHDTDKAGIEAAKAVCQTCPLFEVCREHALASREKYGIWGGLTPAERDKILRPKRRRPRRPVTGRCANGHDLTLPGARYGGRQCKRCALDRQVVYRAKQAARREALRAAARRAW